MTGAPETSSSKIDTTPFFEPGAVDALLQMVLALGSELSAVSEKIDTVIDLLAEQGVTRAATVETFRPNAEQQARRDAARQRLVHALLAPYELMADALAERATGGTADPARAKVTASPPDDPGERSGPTSEQRRC